MKSHRKTLTFNVPERMDFVNITSDVDQAVKESGVREGGEQIFYGEFDGRRDKRVLVKIIGE